MKRLDGQFFRSLLWLLGAMLPIGCALLIGDEDPVKKNSNIKFVAPPAPFSRLNVTSADIVWQSSETGNTIAVNSTCQKHEEKNLKTLASNILLGVDHLNVLSETSEKLDGQDAQRVVSEGKTEGVPVQTDIIILEKNGCTYDVAYIARKKTYEAEHALFNKFFPEFHAP